MSGREHSPIEAAESERPVLNKIEDVLSNVHRVPRLIGPQGEEIELPASVFQLLRQIVYHLAHGRAISIVPQSKFLTTQEAADMLNVSRPYLVKLLEQGEIAFTRVGTHRRVDFDDLMEYKGRRDLERRQRLAELSELNQELGLYGK